MKKTLSALAVAVVATVATAASAQRIYDPAWPDRNPDWRGGQECWNPRAGHFEDVRPGEYQNDLDFNNCRGGRGVYAERYYGDRNDRYVGRIYNHSSNDYRNYEQREECWNPRAGHFEEVRRGEHQNDLDYRRCRVARY